MAGRESGPEAVEDGVIDAVLDASRALVAVSARSIAAAPGLTLPQYRMLVVLDGAASNLRSLAEALDVAPSTALRMVDRLVEAGLVQREVPDGDRRQTVLSLTRTGTRTVRKVTTRRRRDIAAALTELSPERRAAVGRALADFADAAGRTWGPRPER